MSRSKLSPEQWQVLLDKEDIVFERPINSREWPSHYREVFGVVRDIGRTYMDEYINTYDFDLLPLRDQQNRVALLVNAARDCLSTFKGEDDWREQTEFNLLARFGSEAVWYVHRLYLD